MIKESTIQRVKDLPIKEVLERSGLQFVPKGSRYFCCCPLHGEKTPSLAINPIRNSWHCFGCNKGGSAIDFLRERDNLSFAEAVKTIAQNNGIEVEYERNEENADKAREERQKRESQLAVLRAVQEFYTKQFNAETAEAKEAREYACKRWGEEFCKDVGIGYAPRDSRLLLDYLRENAVPEDVAETLGVLGVNEKDGRRYAQLRQRVTIPICDKFGNIIAFTGRYIGANEDIAKYMNSKTSDVFKKNEALFGIDVASRQARASNFFIVVEGAPDVLRLQSIGLGQAVAPLGTALTDRQLDSMRSISNVIRFIPDSDPPKGRLYPPGISAVMKHGRLAVEKGFEVSVREIPRSRDDDKNNIKHDPDSYITCREAYAALEDVPFVVWYAAKRFANADAQNLQMEVVAEVASLLVYIDDELTREMCIDKLCKIFGKAKLWREAMRNAGKKIKEESNSPDELKDFTEHERTCLRSLGIIIKDGCYQAPDKDGNLARWSNFIFRPVLHIKESEKSTRILRMINQNGEEEVIEFSSADFVSVRDFRKKLIDKGNYVWRSDAGTALIAMQEYIFAVTQSATRVENIGWDERERFFSFANGIFADGKFMPIDKLGTVTIANRRYFLPAMSELYLGNKSAFNFERLFRHNTGNGIPLHDFVQSLAEVYGDGAKVCFAWLLAAIFRDVVFDSLQFFPMLNLFGRKGSGKTELAKAIASFFYVLPNTPWSCSNTSIPAIAYMLSHAINTVIILDEFTNELKDTRIDIIKGIWGGTSRSKMEDKQPITIPVSSAVILGGQYKPEDDAIFSRCIHLQYMKTSFDAAEDNRFNKLQRMALAGNSHLLFQILPLREIFEKGFAGAFSLTSADIDEKVRGKGIEARIRKNWIVPLAAFRLLEPHLELPFTFSELFDIVVKGMKFQNDQITKSSDTAEFWHFLESLHSHNRVREGVHYVIKYLEKFRSIEAKEDKVFSTPKRVIFVNFPAIRSLLEQRMSKPKNGNSVSVDTLSSYLKSLPQYMGRKLQRFQFMKQNGELDEEYINTGTYHQKVIKGNYQKAMCFDYDSLKSTLDINLETLRLSEAEEVEDDEQLDNEE